MDASASAFTIHLRQDFGGPETSVDQRLRLTGTRSSTSFSPQAVHPASSAARAPSEGRDWRGHAMGKRCYSGR